MTWFDGSRPAPVALASGRRKRGRGGRRRKRPILAGVVILLALGAVGWLWYAVFAPLFEDPQDWIARERAFRRSMVEILTGDVSHAPPAPELPPWPGRTSHTQRALVACAEGQVARGVKLSTRYHPMGYPWGDLPAHLGASPELIIRCMRDVGLDLQQLIHIDRVRHARRYPLHLWSSTRPDRAIDHRRLANLHTFIKTFSEARPIMADTWEKRAAYLPGDIVFWTTAGRGDHPGLVGIVSDRRDAEAVPFVVTLLPEDRRMSDHHRLVDWPVTGHYRIDAEALLEGFLEDNPTARLVPRPPAAE